MIPEIFIHQTSWYIVQRYKFPDERKSRVKIFIFFIINCTINCSLKVLKFLSTLSKLGRNLWEKLISSRFPRPCVARIIVTNRYVNTSTEFVPSCSMESSRPWCMHAGEKCQPITSMDGYAPSVIPSSGGEGSKSWTWSAGKRPTPFTWYHQLFAPRRPGFSYVLHRPRCKLL